MTDATYVFNQTSRERKQLARQAKYRKNGSRSKKCTLPSDILTRKEWEAMNGEIAVWDLKKFYSWDEFKTMPQDIQIKYLNRLLNIYNATLKDIAELVFMRSATTLVKYTKSKDISKFLNIVHKKRHAMTPSDRKKLIEDTHRASTEWSSEIIIDAGEINNEEPEPLDSSATVGVCPPINDMNLAFTSIGVDGAIELLEKMRAYFDGTEIRIDIRERRVPYANHREG